MEAITVSLNDIKALKALMNEVESIKDNNRCATDDYSYNYKGMEPIIEAKNNEIEKNILTIVKIFNDPNVHYNVVVAMTYDNDLAIRVINDFFPASA